MANPLINSGDAVLVVYLQYYFEICNTALSGYLLSW